MRPRPRFKILIDALPLDKLQRAAISKAAESWSDDDLRYVTRQLRAALVETVDRLREAHALEHERS